MVDLSTDFKLHSERSNSRWLDSKTCRVRRWGWPDLFCFGWRDGVSFILTVSLRGRAVYGAILTGSLGVVRSLESFSFTLTWAYFRVSAVFGRVTSDISVLFFAPKSTFRCRNGDFHIQFSIGKFVVLLMSDKLNNLEKYLLSCLDLVDT